MAEQEPQQPKAESGWPAIGNVVGTASHAEFSFVLQNYRARVGDIVVVRMRVPTDQAGKQEPALVWGRLTELSRYNPFFPAESAIELANEGIRPEDTVLSTMRDQVEAKCLVLGYTLPGDASYSFHPLTYPVEPATAVLRPPASELRGLLTGPAGTGGELPLGHLVSRPDVDVNLRVGPLVSRHMAVLAMTGGGKTVAARTVVSALLDVGYPVLIIDPHGDYLGFVDGRQHLPSKTKVKVFYPYLSLSPENAAIIEVLLQKMTVGQSETQRAKLLQLIRENPVEGHTLAGYFGLLTGKAQQHVQEGGRDAASYAVIMRQLSIVRSKLTEMEKMNATVRGRIRGIEFVQLPDAYRTPWEVVAPNQLSILYLGGYDHLTQSTIVSLVMENLFAHRSSLDGWIPPFFTVVEEAHNFIPGGTESQEDTPSLESLRKIITEGRKFGTGLMLVSQRPSRLDATLLSQCNTFLVLRLVNPNDQTFVRRVMENMSDSDARLLPAFGPGQGIVSGQAVRFPLIVSIRRREEFESKHVGGEDFLAESVAWTPPPEAARFAESGHRQEARVTRRARRPPGRPKKRSR